MLWFQVAEETPKDHHKSSKNVFLANISITINKDQSSLKHHLNQQFNDFMTVRATNFSTQHPSPPPLYGPDVAGPGTTKHHHSVTGRSQKTCHGEIFMYL
jgi:hypothetical protein